MRTENRRQIAKGSLLFSFALTLAASGYSQTRAEPIREHKHETIPVHCEIPFRTYRDYLIVVQGSLGGTLKRNLIIDTGTDPSVIDTRAAQELNMAGVVGKLAVQLQHQLQYKTDRFRGDAGLRFLGAISKCTALVDRANGSGWSFH